MDKTLFDNLTCGDFYTRLFAYMKAVGLNRIDIIYSGGGDSGGMDEMVFHPKMLTAGAEPPAPATDTQKVEKGIQSDLEEELCNPIYNKHGSFADGGGFHVNGVVSYRADNKQVWISGTDHTTTYEGEFDEETGEYESEETSDDDWEELIYEFKESVPRRGREFVFAYLYARDFLGKKLPEEFHNRMVAEAATGDDAYAVAYVKEIKC